MSPPPDPQSVGEKIATDIPLLFFPLLLFFPSPFSPLFLLSFPFLPSLLFFDWGGGGGNSLGGKSFCPPSPISFFPLFFSSSSSFFPFLSSFPFPSFPSLSLFLFFCGRGGGGGARPACPPPLDPRLNYPIVI